LPYGTIAFGKVTTGPSAAFTGSLAGSATIDDAIADTDAGGTVNVLPGVYTETVNVNKSITMRGARAGVNPNDADWNDTRTVADNESILRGVVNLSLRNNIIVDGFTVERTATNEGHVLIGSGLPGGSGTSSSFDLRNNRIIGTRDVGGTAWAGIH